MRVAGIADEAHAARDQIVDAAVIIEDLAIGAGIERVHGEVAPRGILFPVVGEGDDGMAAVGLDVAAQGGDLEGLAARRWR